MEMANNTDKTCSFGGHMLAYLYDELSSEGRERFETHLEGCSRCIDEFAELSEARYSVYEWKNVEFGPLLTPRFVVPSEQAPLSSSWLDSIKAAFAWNGIPVIASAVAILIIGAFGLAILFNSTDTSVATAVEQQPLPVGSATSAVVPTTNTIEASEDENPAIEEPELTTAAPRKSDLDTRTARNQTQSARTKPVSNVRKEAVKIRRTTTNRRLDNSPTLGQYVEDSDETLRLSDLFADLDTRELD